MGTNQRNRLNTFGNPYPERVHVPDGFLNSPTVIVCDVVALCAAAMSIQRAGRELTDRMVPLAGLSAAFIFAVQLIAVPLAVGTSVHILGGVLLAVLIGPATSIVCTTVVLVAQSFVLGFGGITALGPSMLAMYVVPIFLGYWFFRLFLFGLEKLRVTRLRAVSLAAGMAAMVSAVLGALTFVGLVAIGGVGGLDVPLPVLLSVLLVSHVVSGVVEGLLTAGVVRTVLSRRPDLCLHEVRRQACG